VVSRPPACWPQCGAKASRRAARSWSTQEEEAFRAPILAQYELQGHRICVGRLWDDGVVDPLQTRMCSHSGYRRLNAPIEPTRFPVFRI